MKTSLSGKYKAHDAVWDGSPAVPGDNAAWVLLRTIKRIRASDGCLGVERR